MKPRHKLFYISAVVGLWLFVAFDLYAMEDPVIERAALGKTGDTLPQGSVSVYTVDLLSLGVSAGAFDWMQIDANAGYAIWGFGAGLGLRFRFVNASKFKMAATIDYHYIYPLGKYDDPYNLMQAGVVATAGTNRFAIHFGIDVGKSINDFSSATILIPYGSIDAEIMTHWKLIGESSAIIAINAPDERKNGYLGLIAILAGRFYTERFAVDFGIGIYNDSDDRPSAEKDRPLSSWNTIPFPWVGLSYRFGTMKHKAISQPGTQE